MGDVGDEEVGSRGDEGDGGVWGVWGVWGEREFMLPLLPPTPPTPPTLPRKPNTPYFSARGCANGYAQYKCPMSHAPLHQSIPGIAESGVNFFDTLAHFHNQVWRT